MLLIWQVLCPTKAAQAAKARRLALAGIARDAGFLDASWCISTCLGCRPAHDGRGDGMAGPALQRPHQPQHLRLAQRSRRSWHSMMTGRVVAMAARVVIMVGMRVLSMVGVVLAAVAAAAGGLAVASPAAHALLARCACCPQLHVHQSEGAAGEGAGLVKRHHPHLTGRWVGMGVGGWVGLTPIVLPNVQEL